MVRGPIGESPTGGDAYEVKLYNAAGELVTHHVDDRFVTSGPARRRYAQYGDNSAKGPGAWVMLMEKAWAAQRGGFNNLDFGQASDGLRAVTGKSSTWHHIAAEIDRPDPREHRAGGPGRQAGDPNHAGHDHLPAQAWAAANGITLVPSHAYNVESANRTDREIDVANPHGPQPPARARRRELPDDLRLVRHPRRLGAMRLELHETGQSQVDGAWVGAANIWEREPNDREGPSAL